MGGAQSRKQCVVPIDAAISAVGPGMPTAGLSYYATISFHCYYRRLVIWSRRNRETPDALEADCPLGRPRRGACHPAVLGRRRASRPWISAVLAVRRRGGRCRHRGGDRHRADPRRRRGALLLRAAASALLCAAAGLLRTAAGLLRPRLLQSVLSLAASIGRPADEDGAGDG